MLVSFLLFECYVNMNTIYKCTNIANAYVKVSVSLILINAMFVFPHIVILFLFFPYDCAIANFLAMLMIMLVSPNAYDTCNATFL